MSKSNTWETALLNHVFTNAAVANIGDASGLQPSATAGSLYIALHTADPGEAGTQATNEATYTGYARVAVARTGSAWTVSGNQASNAAVVDFAECTGGSNDITHVSIGVSSSGSTTMLYSGALTTPRTVSSGSAPRFAIGAIVFQED